jgi:hypothetical protein
MLHVFAVDFSARYHAFQNRRSWCPAQPAGEGGRRERPLVALQGRVKAFAAWRAERKEGGEGEALCGVFTLFFAPGLISPFQGSS